MPHWMTWFTLSGSWTFYDRRYLYEKNGWNAFMSLSFIPTSSVSAWIGDADIIKEITNDRVRFPKPLDAMEILRVYGASVLTTEDEEWKKHRRISQPAFSERNIRLVWKAGTDVIEELMDDLWENKAEVRTNHALDITIQVALMVLSIAAFGKPMSWKTGKFSSTSGSSDKGGGERFERGHKMSFTQSIYIVSTHLVGALAAPSWALIFTKKLRSIRRAFKELQIYMDEMIAERQEEFEQDPESVSKRGDLLANLISAAAADNSEESDNRNNSGSGSGKRKSLSLNANELRGNVFIYLIAGHETTAHNLCYLLGLLALHPEEQEKLYEQSRQVLGGRRATYDDMPQLTRALAVFYESLRMYPPVTIIPKMTAQDSTFRVSSAHADSRSSTREIVIPKGSNVFLHTMHVHYDPKYYPEPEKFNPDRFIGNHWNKDVFLAFSLGARSCIGRKFAEVEVVAALTALIPRYTIHLTDEMEAEFISQNLTLPQKMDRLLKSNALITTTPLDVPLVFRKRLKQE